MRLDESTVLGLVSRIYEAAEDPKRWEPLILTLTDLTESVAGAFHVHDPTRGYGSVAVNIGGDPVWVRRYEEYYAAINPWVKKRGPLIRPGDVIVGSAALDLMGSEYYEDFWAPQGFRDSLMSYLFREEALTGGVILVRPKGALEFDDAHARLLRTLTPHMQRAVELQRRFYRSQGNEHALEALLDRAPCAAAALDSRRRVVFLNASARVLLAARDGVQLSGLEFTASAWHERPKLRALIDEAIGSSQGKGFSSGGMIVLARTMKQHALVLTVAPCGASGDALAGSTPAALVLIDDPGKLRALDIEVVRQVHGLTPTEARVAVALAEGQSVADICRALRLSPNTVRTHLKRAFLKTGTNRQAELIRILLNTALR